MSDHPDGLSDLVTQTHIARRLHLTRAGIGAAARRPDFPEPLGRLGPSLVWRWSDVRAWAEGAAGRPGGPSEEGLRLAGIRDRFRTAGFRLKLEPDPENAGWRAIRVARGGPSSGGEAFTGRDPLEAAERALEWLQTHR